MKLTVDNLAHFDVYFNDQLITPNKTIQQKEYYDIPCEKEYLELRFVYHTLDFTHKGILQKLYDKFTFFLEQTFIIKANSHSAFEVITHIDQDIVYSKEVLVPVVEVSRKKNMDIISVEKDYSPYRNFRRYLTFYVAKYLILYLLIVLMLLCWTLMIINHPITEIDLSGVTDRMWLFSIPILFLLFTHVFGVVIIGEIRKHKVILGKNKN